MADVTETRESGIEILDIEPEELSEDAEAVVFRTEEETEVQVAESAGNPVVVNAQYFIAASIETETDEMTEMMTGQETINESSVFISNEEGEVGGGFIQVDEGEIEDALDRFEDDYL
jgi:hypothetical protein